jgi:3-phenylpropionate/trans-cinnamate dioxygenase ferredoxin reductase component
VIVLTERVVVAGAGLAGLRTVEELRSQGYTGAVTLIGAERRPPYDRPPLSKQLMAGAIDDTTLRDDLSTLGAEVRLGETATDLEPGLLRTSRGEHRFDRLVLATGAAPVALPGPGRQRFLRTLDDALELRRLLRPGLRLAIAGAGWIGAELATAAARRGCQVTVVEAAPTPLAAVFCPVIGDTFASWYAEAGIRLLTGQPVASAEPGGLALQGGGWLAADEVVTAVGARPDLGFLQGSGLRLDLGGVAVDELLAASMPGVFAVGDCAAFRSRRYQRRMRVEHWDTALRGPAAAAANVLGGALAYDPVPYFWSEQFGRMIQYAGSHAGAPTLVWRGDPGGDRWAACWLDGDRLRALLAVGLPRDLIQGQRVIAAGTPVDPARLADPAVPVRAATLS